MIQPTTAPQLEAGPLAQPTSVDGPSGDGECPVSQIAELLRSLESVAADSGLSTLECRSKARLHENKLVSARLGIASALHTALRCKHAPSAAHALRVAVGCSNWAAAVGIPDDDRDLLEVAALLHDIGKIGVPDQVLVKPGRLLPEEVEIVKRHRELAADMLVNCGAPPELLAIVVASAAWFDGTHAGVPLSGEQIPHSARMLAIVDAFDSMTTDHVYRPAKSRERAVAELFQFAGTQFDPTLVRSFSEWVSQDQSVLGQDVSSRWLGKIVSESANLPWQPTDLLPEPKSSSTEPTELYRGKLIDNMHDGVVFVDCQRRILFWNTGMERISGVSSTAAAGRAFVPSLLEMADQRGRSFSDARCPVQSSLSSGVQALHRITILGRLGRPVKIDLHVMPVRGSDGTLYGAAVLFHDATSEVTLEEKCESLYSRATKDPLTQLANRAEFDRVLAEFIEVHLASGLPCSLIMTDIDFFKQINDSHGHQAGDDAIIAITDVLKSMSRSGDLVARYGGEEFVILCADCNNATAARRAEQLRRCVADLSHQGLGNRRLTASFGVTELQAGDTPETILRRADRALLQAKDQGRNRVIQLGEGMMNKPMKKSWWPFQLKLRGGRALVEATLITNVPIEIAIQKLRGFIADHGASIAKIGEDEIRLETTDRTEIELRRRDDQPISFFVDIKFQQERLERSNSHGFAAGSYVQTKAQVAIGPRRERDRRLSHATVRARMMLASLKSYMMAREEAAAPVFLSR